MSKNPLQGRAMSDVATAAKIARRMVQAESRGPGDTINAMRRMSARYGLSFNFLWSLRYRPPADILMRPYRLLISAYEAERERQMRRLEHDILLTEAKAGLDCPAVRKARALLDAGNEEAGAGV